jgi:hypothetical protein
MSSAGAATTIDAGRIDRLMKIDPNTTIRRPRRALACLALLLALIASAALSAGAFARPAHGHKAPCNASHHAKHGAKHCAKHHTTKHKAKKPAAKPSAPAPKLTPAECEDGSAPVRSASGSYGCEDGSEPACEDGSEAIRPSAASAPMCRVPTGEDLECGLAEAGGECGVEFACEDAEESVATPSQGCEHGSAFEEEPEPGV